jgi:hypothetical protein
MPMLTLGQAARLAGVGKTTLTRAIKAGRLSATRREDGGYSIDPSELARVYEIRLETHETGIGDRPAVHRATPDTRPQDSGGDPDVTARLAALEAELAGLKALLGEVRDSREELRRDRDEWREQSARLALMRPAEAPTPVGAPVTVSAETPRRSWWRRLAG